MSNFAQSIARFQELAAQSGNGIVGLVDDLLKWCAEQRIQLDWQAESCKLRSLETGAEATIEESLPSSAFRGVLARLASLCNQHQATSVTPYGGNGELHLTGHPAVVFRVSFANTVDSRWLKLSPVQPALPAAMIALSAPAESAARSGH